MTGWVYLVAAGVCEIFYAAAMPAHGWVHPALAQPVLWVFFIALSMYLLSLAMQTMQVDTAYAAWVGIGAVAKRSTRSRHFGRQQCSTAAVFDGSSVRRALYFGLIIFGICWVKLFSLK